jgi:hypothetical protein
VKQALDRWVTLPGYEIVESGVRDLQRHQPSVEALMVALCAARIRAVGIDLPDDLPDDPVKAVHDDLERELGDDAHRRYNALKDRMVSFLNAAEGAAG